MGAEEGREEEGKIPRCVSALMLTRCVSVSMWAEDSMGGEEGRKEEGEIARCVSALRVKSESGAALDTEL